MGAVWSGTDHTLGRVVALKQIGLWPGAATPDTVRAEREARLAARLSHPNVVAVFDLLDDDAGQQWMVMEHVVGTNLSELIRANGAFSPDHIAPILAQVAAALAAAHAAGIVHRDIKPSNILVAEDGTVKLSDFGIARTEADAALTQTGLVTGSPAYLAPEVASGQMASEASDVWSLGATLCHALTGSPPYEVGDNVMGALFRIVNEEPPRPEAAGWLAPVLAATMTKDPAQRWSAAQVREFLEAGAPAIARPPNRTGTHRATADANATQRMPTVHPTRTAPRLPASPPASAPPGRSRRRWFWGQPLPLLALTLTAFVVLALAIGWATRDTTDSSQAGGDPSASATSTPSPAAATAEQMEDFVADYLALAASDPTTAFEQLTAGFQQASNGLDGYLGFWDRVSEPELISIEADEASLTVNYRYRYRLEGSGRRTDNVSLQLEQTADGGFLIAGEA